MVIEAEQLRAKPLPILRNHYKELPCVATSALGRTNTGETADMIQLQLVCCARLYQNYDTSVRL